MDNPKTPRISTTSNVSSLVRQSQYGIFAPLELRRQLQSIDWVQKLKLKTRLKGHAGCVNTIEWNKAGTHLLTGSDDLHLGVWHAGGSSRIRTGHFANIFSAEFYNNDHSAVTCGMDGTVRSVDLESGKNRLVGANARGMFYRLFFPPFSQEIVYSTQQGGLIERWDLRTDERSTVGDLTNVTTMAWHPWDGTFACATTTGRVHHCGTNGEIISSWKSGNASTTGIDFNGEGDIVTTRDDNTVLLYNTRNTDFRKVFVGHFNMATFLKEVAFLYNSRFIATGSDNGNVVVWDRSTKKLVRQFRGDAHIVNGISPHPTLPSLAVCGIDSDAKVFDIVEEDLEVEFSQPSRQFTFGFESDSSEGLDFMDESDSDGEGAHYDSVSIESGEYSSSIN